MTSSGDPASPSSNEFSDWYLIKLDESPHDPPSISKKSRFTKILSFFGTFSLSCSFEQEGIANNSAVIAELSTSILKNEDAEDPPSAITSMETRDIKNFKTKITKQIAKPVEKKMRAISHRIIIEQSKNSLEIPIAKQVILKNQEEKIFYIDSKHGYVVGAHLGNGSNKVAHLAKRIFSDSFLAYLQAHKIDSNGFSLPSIDSRLFTSIMNNEIEKLNLFKGEEEFLQIISVVYNKKSETKGCFVEYCDGGNLMHLLDDLGLNEEQAWDLAETLARGLVKMQNKDIIHHDLKPDNIFIKNGKFKIADFGFASKFNSENLSELACRTVLYSPPECNMIKGASREKSDNWSVGIIIYVALYGEFPRFLSDSPRRIASINDKKIDQTPPFNKIDHKDGKDTPLKIIRDLLRVKPAERLSATELQSRLSALRSDGVMLNPRKKEPSIWSYFFPGF